VNSGTRLQLHLSEYLQYELYHSLGAYGVAEKSHEKLAQTLAEEIEGTVQTPARERAEEGRRTKPPFDALATLVGMSANHNWELRTHRNGLPRNRVTLEPYDHQSPGAEAGVEFPFREPMPSALPLTHVGRFKFAKTPYVDHLAARGGIWCTPGIWACIPRFYVEVLWALKDHAASASIDAQQPSVALPGASAAEDAFREALRRSVVAQFDNRERGHGREGAESAMRRDMRYERFGARLQAAHEELDPLCIAHTNDGDDTANRVGDPRCCGVEKLKRTHAHDASFLEQICTDNLSTSGESLPMYVIRVLAEAHLSMHAVLAWKRMCFGEWAEEHSEMTERWLEGELERCVTLNTFAYSISRNAPWLFAADAQECDRVREDPEAAWHHVVPVRNIWVANQVRLLALLRRAAARALKGDRELAYNDYHKLLRLIRHAEHRIRAAPIQVEGGIEFLTALDGLAHYNIGELYRAHYAQRPARKHFIVASHSFDELRGHKKFADVLVNSRCAVELQVSQGKAAFELGRYKEALCWHLRAWQGFLKLLADETEAVTNTEAIQRAITWLERVRYDPEMLKSELVKQVGPVVEQLEQVSVSTRYGTLAGEILLRLGHLLMVLDLSEDHARSEVLVGHARGEQGLAYLCLLKAFDCDRHSTMVVADLLKAELQLARHGLELPARTKALEATAIPGVRMLWPRGRNAFEQLARAMEYLTLLRQREVGSGSDESKWVQMARNLLFEFFMNTDSINVRKSQGYSLLTRSAHPSAHSPEVALEFICMRRYSSPTPLLPRPSAFRALCGGYFIRLHSSARDPYGIVVDPGVDFVENLYRSGYAMADIDMIVITHDHVDHAGALDNLLSLWYARGRALRGVRDEPDPPMTIVLCESMSKRYEGAKVLKEVKKDKDGKQHASFVFRGVNELAKKDRSDPHLLKAVKGFPAEFEMLSMSSGNVAGAGHTDLSGTASFGVCIRIKKSAGVGSGSVAITSDTPAPPPAKDIENHERWLKCWSPALSADVLVAHLSSVPLSELRKVAEPHNGERARSDRDRTPTQTRANAEKIAADMKALKRVTRALLDSGAVEEGLVDWGLWLGSANTRAPIVGAVPGDWEPPVQHSWLKGIRRWAQAYAASREQDDTPGLFIVGELNEELGMMRSKVAASINEHVFGLSSPKPAGREGDAAKRSEDVQAEGDVRARPHALTGDIGLTALVKAASRGTEPKVSVLCTTCSLDADRVLAEQYHRSSDISETVVKGENEGTFYSCHEHSPSGQEDPFFLEQLERFDIFGR
jgi:tetratricopeptide (TPR) repeat protein